MALMFRNPPVDDKRLRGLVEEARASFEIGFAGDLEFGHLFRVEARQGQIWRWRVYHPVVPQLEGTSASRDEAVAHLTHAYEKLLDAANLREVRPRRAKRDPIRRRTSSLGYVGGNLAYAIMARGGSYSIDRIKSSGHGAPFDLGPYGSDIEARSALDSVEWRRVDAASHAFVRTIPIEERGSLNGAGDRSP